MPANPPASRTDAAPATPPHPEVAAALDRLCTSTSFRTSRQLTAFLRYVVEAVQSGQGSTLKAYTIAVDALGRSSDFDPMTDAIVRVEARRLRLALADYYEGDGADDPIVIDLRPGSYAPNIVWRVEGGGAETPGVESDNGDEADALLIYARTMVTDGHTAIFRQQYLVARCYRVMAVMQHRIAVVKCEVETSKTLIAQSRRLIERSRNGRPKNVI